MPRRLKNLCLALPAHPLPCTLPSILVQDPQIGFGSRGSRPYDYAVQWRANGTDTCPSTSLSRSYQTFSFLGMPMAYCDNLSWHKSLSYPVISSASED